MRRDFGVDPCWQVRSAGLRTVDQYIVAPAADQKMAEAVAVAVACTLPAAVVERAQVVVEYDLEAADHGSAVLDYEEVVLDYEAAVVEHDEAVVEHEQVEAEYVLEVVERRSAVEVVVERAKVAEAGDLDILDMQPEVEAAEARCECRFADTVVS